MFFFKKKKKRPHREPTRSRQSRSDIGNIQVGFKCYDVTGRYNQSILDFFQRKLSLMTELRNPYLCIPRIYSLDIFLTLLNFSHMYGYFLRWFLRDAESHIIISESVADATGGCEDNQGSCGTD